MKKVRFDDALLRTWPHHWYGLFVLTSEENTSLPTLDAITDPNWDISRKTEILEYLRTAPMALGSFAKPTYCCLCGENLGDPGCFRTDNLWLWPNMLYHFVSKHDVRLPDSFIEHIVESKYQVPDSVSVPIRELPWP
jgi:hypothetical protein